MSLYPNLMISSHLPPYFPVRNGKRKGKQMQRYASLRSGEAVRYEIHHRRVFFVLRTAPATVLLHAKPSESWKNDVSNLAHRRNTPPTYVRLKAIKNTSDAETHLHRMRFSIPTTTRQCPQWIFPRMCRLHASCGR